MNPFRTQLAFGRARFLLPAVAAIVLIVGGPKAQAAAPAPQASGPTTLWQPYRITPRSGAQHLSLDGRWQLSHRDAAISDPAELDAQAKWISADVPGTVQWALHRAGELPHPYEHLNAKQYAWVDEKVWYYQTSVEIPVPDKSHLVFLCFDGIDYFSRVWFNGQLLGRHEGMFGGPVAEVSQLIRPGKNTILVEVKAANYGIKDRFQSRKLGPIIKPWVLAGGVGAEAFFPLGMWQGARIEIVPPGHMERPFLVTEEAGPDHARLSLSLELLDGTHSLEHQLHLWNNANLHSPRVAYRDAWTSKPSRVPFALRVELTDKANGQTALEQVFPINTFTGRNFVKHSLVVPRPKLWWPNGMGDPNLYRVKLTLLRDNKAEDQIEFDYGIRTIQMKPSAGPQTIDRWADWQMVVNGQPLFVKGINWMPADILLDLPIERYRWLLGTAKAAGMQMIRIWGGGILETEEFYQVCNELGIMVWQDFPIGNQDTPEWAQDIWEAQVMQNIYRLRNHPALVLYCGGNEFNPYSRGNATTIGILERSLADFDSTRPFRRTSPDAGSLHTYPDMDPTWYNRLYRLVPWMAETGMHNIPDPASLREVVDNREFVEPLSEMFSKEFPKKHPDLIHHFVEYAPSRVPRMLSRASHIDDMNAPTLESLAEASQIGAGEFYQILSDALQANYPTTTGLLPWVFKRPWPVIAIMLVDGHGHPTAPYYFLKRTYEPTHVLVKLPHLMWAKEEPFAIQAAVVHAPPTSAEGLSLTVRVLDPRLAPVWEQKRSVAMLPGPSVTELDLGQFTIPASFEDQFFFVVAELQDSSGQLVSRSVYWPRCLARMSDAAFRTKYRNSPQPAIALDKGPWLKPQVAAVPTALDVALVDCKDLGADRSALTVRIRNQGSQPAVNVSLDIAGTKRSFHATDNYFWLAPGEQRELELQVLWRDPTSRNAATLTVGAWNAKPRTLKPRCEAAK